MPTTAEVAHVIHEADLAEGHCSVEDSCISYLPAAEAVLKGYTLLPKDARHRIAETIWRAEFRRGCGKERLISWDEVGPDTQTMYLFLADAILEGN